MTSTAIMQMPEPHSFARAEPLLAEAHAPEILRIEGLTKRYGSVAAVDNVSLGIRKGEFLTLLGPSGSGKTTLLMMLAGFTAPTAGEIRLRGADVAPLPPEKREFGMVFQGYALFPHLSVFDNVAFPLTVRRSPPAQRREKVLDALRTVHMEAFADRMPRQLSGGQQQRVALARAIIFAPELLLLDEPLGALDRQLRATLQDELKTLHRKLGTTFVCVTHDQDEAMSMSDRVVVMRGGRIVQVGAPAMIYERPKTRFVANFLGESNILKARVVGHHRAGAVVEVAGQRLEVGGEGSESSTALLAVRPERLQLAEERPPSGFAVRGRISDVTFMGADHRVRVTTSEFGTLIVKLRAPRDLRVLTPSALTWVCCEPGALWRVEGD